MTSRTGSAVPGWPPGPASSLGTLDVAGGQLAEARALLDEALDLSLAIHINRKVENQLHAMVCAGKISLHNAQLDIAHNWTTAP